jgi:hypothetical protein
MRRRAAMGQARSRKAAGKPANAKLDITPWRFYESPAVSATFNTGATPGGVDVALLLSDRFPEDGEPDDAYKVSLDGGIPLSKLSSDPISGLNYVNGFSVNFGGSLIESVNEPRRGAKGARAGIGRLCP